MLTIVEIDRQCKCARKMIKRSRCKLRKRLVSSAPEIFIADIRDIIIDYCLINRKFVDVIRNIGLGFGQTFPDLKLNMRKFNESYRFFREFYITLYATNPIQSFSCMDHSYSISIRTLLRYINNNYHTMYYPKLYSDFDMQYRPNDVRGHVIEYLNRCIPS